MPSKLTNSKNNIGYSITRGEYKITTKPNIGYSITRGEYKIK